MSWGTCLSGSNNIHFDSPPLMSDGRNFASWQPGAKLNQQLRNENNIKSNWQYRKYLQNNADFIIKYNQMEACNECSNCPVTYGKPLDEPNKPYLYKSSVQSTQPFGYENSDLKSLYLSEYQLQCRMYTPVISQDQLLSAGYQNYN